MGTLLGVDHALAPPTGRQARLGVPPRISGQLIKLGLLHIMRMQMLPQKA